MENFTEQEKTELISLKKILYTVLWSKFQDIPLPPTFDYNKIFLSGGAITSILRDEDPKDYDLYFKDADYRDYIIAYLKNSCEHQIKDMQTDYHGGAENGKMVTNFAITMKNQLSFISFVAGEPSEVKKHFDFVHCTSHYDLGSDKLYISKQQYYAAKNKILIVNNQKGVTSERENKFFLQGYRYASV